MHLITYYTANVTVFGISEFRSLGRNLLPLVEPCKAAAVIKMAYAIKQRIILCENLPKLERLLERLFGECVAPVAMS